MVKYRIRSSTYCVVIKPVVLVTELDKACFFLHFVELVRDNGIVLHRFIVSKEQF